MYQLIKDLFALRSRSSFVKRMYEKIDEHKKNENEIWHYICQEGHKWKSYSSPKGNAGGGVNLCYEECTKCPICKTEVCMGNVYINGKETQMGAMHCDFKIKKTK